ncbi:Arc family DNA-binding protein [Bacillus sp. NTK034]|uniref:Arc family DNA-binding protein n=1 Tax=Bacillus sp. NTK034 TaxID=2802176 RepID=UPI001A8F091D|nr:Arc family DNA-binding protein [Bacillus sp. NTK034]MBN8200505.1 Arc family DNA-binding protein [Bacillus sp. NTK034]
MSEQKRFTLRMDSDLFKVIEQRAAENKRSIAKEIEFLLEQHIKEENKDSESSN